MSDPKQNDPLDLISRLSVEERTEKEILLRCISPDDAKYGEKTRRLSYALSHAGELEACATVQKVLLETRVEFGEADPKHLEEVKEALHMFNPVNAALLEDRVTKHDQLAVIEELGRHISLEAKNALHPGTTSYDILDTARSYAFKSAWFDVIRPEVAKAIERLCDISEKYLDEHEGFVQDKKVSGSDGPTDMPFLSVGRTHLQDTSPVPFGVILSRYTKRLATRLELCDQYFDNLKGKVSGIVGTGASIDMVFPGKAMEFEGAVLEKLGLEPDYSSTQIVQKEGLADVGHGLTTLMLVLENIADDMRLRYSSALGEVTSRDNAKRLGGSSADATKNNPINWENICGTAPVVEGGMRLLYSMIGTNFERDLRASKTARYQPQAMMAETYESFQRFHKVLGVLSVNQDRMADNLQPVRNNPSEAMVAILRSEGFTHPEYGTAHDFVKKIGIKAKKSGQSLLNVAMADEHFSEAYDGMAARHQGILCGALEDYIGDSLDRAAENIKYARRIIHSDAK